MRVVLKGQSLVAMAERASMGSAELLQPLTRCVPRLCTVRATASASPTLHAVDRRQFSRDTLSRVQCCRQQEYEWDWHELGETLRPGAYVSAELLPRGSTHHLLPLPGRLSLALG